MTWLRYLKFRGTYALFGPPMGIQLDPSEYTALVTAAMLIVEIEPQSYH